MRKAGNTAILKWLENNLSQHNIPLSFRVPDKYAKTIWENSINEFQRIILNEGLIIYDGSLAQIILALNNKFDKADAVTDVMLNASLGDFGKDSLRAYYDSEKLAEHPFIYSDNHKEVQGKRQGLLFSIINAQGNYLTQDPLNGKKVAWADWVPKIGENAWAGGIGPLQVYFLKYGRKLVPDAKELKLSESIAKAGLLLLASNGGVRMSPKNTFHEEGPDFFYNTESTENNESFYGHIKLLYQITGKKEYKHAVALLERFFRSAFNKESHTFCRGMHLNSNRTWIKDTVFATDVQTWGVLALGPEKIDNWFGAGTTYRMLKDTANRAGVCDNNGLKGMDFTDYRIIKREGVVFPEQSFIFVMANLFAADYYKKTKPAYSELLAKNAHEVTSGLEKLKLTAGEMISYPYASKGQIATGHGWFSPADAGPAPEHKVQSLSATGWAYFSGLKGSKWKIGFNPFCLGGEYESSSF